MADKEYNPEEGSLDEFEKDLIAKEKKKAQRNVVVGAVLLVVLAGAGFYLYSSMSATPEPPPPPVAVPVPQAAPAPAPAPATTASEHVAPAPAAPTKTEAKAAPAKAPAKTAAPAPAAKADAKKEPAKAAATAPTAVPAEQAVATGGYTLQLGVFLEKGNARALMERVAKLGLTAETMEKEVNAKSIGVYTGYYRYRELADEGAAKVAKDGFANRVVIKGPGNYTVEVGSYKTDREADATVKKLEAKGYKVDLDYTTVKKHATVVLVRGIEGEKLAEITGALKENKLDYLVLKKK